ncbi:SLC13 family permease [Membranihabitans maritimus]|uniref:SLC13 family permease n=1 Tax=Membranihabitans maritimus TaxID=2904244 RepID=UPI002104A127|nr:SLC13 family permease [Membranihabitans maritimus]
MALTITLIIIFIAIFLFVKDYFSIDTTSILIMALFITTGVLSPEEGFAGFNHPATITLGCMFVVSSAIFKTGLIDSLSDRIIRIAKIHYLAALVVFCSIAVFFSAFINDSAVVALLIPMALLVCRETGIYPSKLLIPISFSALFGGTCTLIGTSTNILVSAYAEKSGLQPFGVFEFSMPALCLLAIGIAYLFFIAPTLLPRRKIDSDDPLSKESERYIAEITINENCPDNGKKALQSRLVTEYGAEILSITRIGSKIRNISDATLLKEKDIVKVIINPTGLTKVEEAKGYAFKWDSPIQENESEDRKIYEVIIPFGSDLVANTLRKLNFKNTYQSVVLAIRHRNESITKDLSNVELKEGDMMLIYASESNISPLINQKSLVILSEYKKRKINYKKAIPALLIAIGVILAAALNIVSILTSSMIGCLLLVTTSILKPKEAYEAIEWKVIFMMAGVLSMGKALEKTGGSDIISGYIFDTLGNMDPRITLSLIFLITFLSTNVLSSKAAAALMAPIVISLADTMGISERPFLLAVMFACSLTFMTPISYPTNTMVYAPGNYKFNDFLKVGTPLNIIIWIAASFIIPMFFPF